MEDVLSNVRESFLDEGVDEQVLQELKQVLYCYGVIRMNDDCTK